MSGGRGWGIGYPDPTSRGGEGVGYPGPMSGRGEGVGYPVVCLGGGCRVSTSHVQGVGGCMGSRAFVLGEGVPYHVIYPMTWISYRPFCEQTDACENVSFPKLRLRVVMSDLEVLYSNRFFLALFD